MLLHYLLETYIRVEFRDARFLGTKRTVQIANQLRMTEPLIRFGFLIGLFIHRLLGRQTRRIPLLGSALKAVDAVIEMNSREFVATQHVGSPSDHEFRKIWDFVVVGSGPGGSIAALNGIDCGRETLLVECGGKPRNIEHHSTTQLVEMFAHGGQQLILSPRPIAYAQGRTLGGGSEVNSGLYHRIPSAVKDEWTNACFLSSELLDIAQQDVEKKLEIESQSSRTLGVYSNSPIKKFSETFGWECELIPRWRKYQSDSHFSHLGMNATYLQEATNKGLRIITDSKVVRLSQSKGLIELEVSNGRDKNVIRAKKVCISAGTVETPRLLLRSALAVPSDFRFGFHSMTRVIAEFDHDVNDLRDIDPHQAWTEGLQFKFGAGVATESLLAATLRLQGLSPSSSVEARRMSVFYASTVPRGKSRFVRIGNIHYPMFVPDKKSESIIKQGDKLLRNAISSLEGAKVYSLQTRHPTVSSVHVFGSIPLGTSRIVDTRGQLLGSNNKIQILDASLLPTAPRVNPQGPLMALLTGLLRDSE